MTLLASLNRIVDRFRHLLCTVVADCSVKVVLVAELRGNLASYQRSKRVCPSNCRVALSESDQDRPRYHPVRNHAPEETILITSNFLGKAVVRERAVQQEQRVRHQ